METNRQQKTVAKLRKHPQRVFFTFAIFAAAVVSVAVLAASFLGGHACSTESYFRRLGLRPGRCGDGEGCFAFYNVGNGDCSAVYTEQVFGLMDTGTEEYASSLVAKLQALQVDHLDFIVISHPHEDHAGGYARLLEHFSVDQLYIRSYLPSDFEDYEYYQELLSLSRQYHVAVTYVTDRMTVTADGLSMEFYAPTFYTDDENERSLVTMVTIGEKRCLFTGDAGLLTESVLLRLSYPLQADLLKLGHHGSLTGTGEAFLDSVAPNVAVVCVGENLYGHPSDTVTRRLALRNIPLYRTDCFDSIVFMVSNHDMIPFTE